MGVAPTPAQIFSRAVEEGERRLDQSMLEPVSTSFIAGFTIVLGIVGDGTSSAAVASSRSSTSPRRCGSASPEKRVRAGSSLTEAESQFFS